MSSPTDNTAIDRRKILSENEWLEIINHQTQSENINEEEKRKLAQILVYHFMTIDDAILVTEQQWVQKFRITSRNIVEKIVQWQKSFLPEVTTTSSYKEKPLVGLYETMRNPISEGDVVEAFRQLRTVNRDQAGGFLRAYQSFVDALIEYGSSKYKRHERIWFRCRTCRKTVWIAKNMGAFTSFPACFKCQFESWADIFNMKSSTIPEDELD